MCRPFATVLLVAACSAGPTRSLWAADPERPTLPAAAAVLPADPQRPAVLPLLYVGLAAANAFDVYTTHAALERGAREANPLMRPFAGHAGAALVVKAATTTTTMFFVERLWRRHRIAAIVILAAANGVTTAVAARNLRHARQ